MRTPHLRSIYESSGSRAKWPTLALAALAVLGEAGTAKAQTVHLVRLEVEPDHDVYRFVPARVTARAGDVVRFRVSSGGPHNIAFEGDHLAAAERTALNAAMSGRSGDLSGPVLERAGAEYRIVVPALPPGRYEFFCTPHRVYDMRGEMIVVR